MFRPITVVLVSSQRETAMPVPDIVILEDDAIPPEVLVELLSRFFEDMVKYVVDVRRGVVAVGGELHADAEALLLAHGSLQEDIWGANYYPGEGEEGCIEYTSLINVRPSQDNRSMIIQDDQLRDRVREITFRLIGRGGRL